MKLKNYAEGHWVESSSPGVELFNAVTGEKIAEASSEGLDYAGMLKYGRLIGARNLRRYTFHDRAKMLKQLAMFLTSKKDEFYKLSYATGATRNDSWVDIEGGIATLFTYASKGRRELPDEKFLMEGKPEQISKNGTFIGHHICVPLEGTAVHINAFNFPCWGMLEKFAPTFLAGMPAIIKPATITSYLTEAIVREIINSKILPEGSIQLVCGSLGDMLSHLTCQDVVTFTGSASTALKIKQTPVILENAVRFNQETDSLNFSLLGMDAYPDTPEYSLFIKEVVREMTAKAGQKCTAIRRALVPSFMVDDVLESLKARLQEIKIGDPQLEGVRMGPLAAKVQAGEVRERVGELMKSSELVTASLDDFLVYGGNKEAGAFFPTTLLYSEKPFDNYAIHDIEAFGPVCTVMPYLTNDDAIELAKMGKGSLVGSIFTADNEFARDITLGTAAYHGRIMIINRDCAAESTGHGSPLPHLVHGGPGRAGGGEELGGIRAVKHYMQRTALQGSPTTLSYIADEWYKGAETEEDIVHPFRKYFEELEIGDRLATRGRTVTEADIVNFAGISGDYFYAHTDETALEGSLFESRCAHGYFIISAAAGLFVDPKKGPVLANYGIDELRFIQPVYIGDTIHVNLTVKQKTKKEHKEGEIPQGIVKWDVEVFNQRNETVAQATILTLVRRKE